ncbi:hypothetical protein AGABI2DRAFT_191490 [Agaricus bisporus var. bisporus H97]|uniref:hypothetical protein n=1 Tax=Agaricus bisporus var. bisporus (strain H97 / ATCC MYA-4626 / FGSC 10389) TaxID=936046 RepID=UPI00029F6DEA|nr:hypothetical protein AGABI2DRAFT_191490 [Agaricus bisporus var. bisporus H97]EKV49469.1 hypothetical protein AGABI2DRAFT_191490 [Agaricus bisporus var. bisporus H97]
MSYSLSNPLGGCTSDQSLPPDHGVNRTWPKGFHTAFGRNTSHQSATNPTNPTVSYSPANSYHQLSPVYDPRSPNSFSRSFAQSSQETLFSLQTNTRFKCEPEYSPRNLSPSSATSQFYADAHHLRGSTPSLASSGSTPPTGRSIHIPLTPDPNFQPGNTLPLSPNHYNNTKTNSPMPYNGSTGATPELGALHLEDSGFPLATSAGGLRPLERHSSSVLLDSTFNSQNLQRTHLDPLEFEHDLAALDAHTSNTGSLDEEYNDINISIVSDDPNPHNVPVTVMLDSQSGWNPPLSPLQFNAIPMDYEFDDSALQDDIYRGVTIGRPTWTLDVSSPVPSPNINVTYSPHNGRPESLTPSSSQTVFPGTSNQTGTPCKYESDPQGALEAIRNGQNDIVKNPRGVSDRTLEAARANRKREAKFWCNICGNSQTSKQNLDNHIMSRHLQLKRFVCPVPGCDAKYGHARGVNRHLDNKHPGHRQGGVKGKRGPPKRTPT